jgi:hypothetical protein
MIEADPVPPPAKGLQLIETALATMPADPGVYRLLDAPQTN